MRKLYRFDTPEQLKDAQPLCKECGVLTVARVWNANRNKGGACPWDGNIMASFYTQDGKNRAVVIRIDTMGELHEVATLKLTPALAWCKERLTEIPAQT